MTKRIRCPNCLRAESTCLCHLAQAIPTQTKFFVLQHPNETKHALNTAILAGLCLPNMEIWSHSDFNKDDRLLELVKMTPPPYLLFPQEHSLTIDSTSVSTQVFDPTAPIIILDGTWRKCYKMLQSTRSLQSLKTIQLKPAEKSNYRIRKSPKAHSLSTIEAIYSLLTLIESESTKLQPLMTIFNGMIEQQIKHMGKKVYQNNYQKKQ